jgi:hypothetical protein
MFSLSTDARIALMATTLVLKMSALAAGSAHAEISSPDRLAGLNLEVSAAAISAGAAAIPSGGSQHPDPAPVTQGTAQPPARLIVYPPVPSQLAHGRVVLQYRTENLFIRPVFGPAALEVSPRIGHLHITVDGASWRWLDASNEPAVINGLPPGPHKVLIELVDPTHRTIDQQSVSFTVPEKTTR